MKCRKNRGIRLTLNEFGKATVQWKKVIPFSVCNKELHNVDRVEEEKTHRTFRLYVVDKFSIILSVFPSKCNQINGL